MNKTKIPVLGSIEHPQHLFPESQEGSEVDRQASRDKGASPRELPLSLNNVVINNALFDAIRINSSCQYK